MVTYELSRAAAASQEDMQTPVATETLRSRRLFSKQAYQAQASLCLH